jgi:hypothetical protein
VSVFRTAQPRTPRSVINEAIRETAGWDTLCWWGVVFFGLIRGATILGGLLTANVWVSVVGIVPSALCWPAVSYAISIRRANVALRLMELALNNTSSADEALLAINRAFGFHFSDEKDKKNVVLQSKTTSS